MVQLAFAAVLALFFLIILGMRRVYYCVSAKELKRLARTRDPVGARLHKVVAFGDGLMVLLWFLTGAFAASSFALSMAALPWPAAGLGIAVLLWLGFGWVATAFPPSFMVQFTAAVSPAVTWILSHGETVFAPVGSLIRRYHRTFEHTGLYEKQDLAELFARQKTQLDNRMAPEEIELMERVLSFGDKTTSDVVTPRQKVREVRLNETIGPKLLDELHQTGQQLFPVCEETGERIVGLARLEDLVKARHGGTVKAVATEAVFFVRDDFPLSQVLDVFRRTGQQLLVVINNFEEFVGVVMLDSVLGQLIGWQSDNPAENIYSDRVAVAQYESPAPEKPSDLELEQSAEAEAAPEPSAPEPATDTEAAEPSTLPAPPDHDTQEKPITEDPEVVE